VLKLCLKIITAPFIIFMIAVFLVVAGILIPIQRMLEYAWDWELYKGVKE
jgi:hypothetical protein